MKRYLLFIIGFLALFAGVSEAALPWYGTGTATRGVSQWRTYKFEFSGTVGMVTIIASGGGTPPSSRWIEGAVTWTGTTYTGTNSGNLVVSNFSSTRASLSDGGGSGFIPGTYSQTPPPDTYSVTINITTVNRYNEPYYVSEFPDRVDSPITWGAIWAGEALYSFFSDIPADGVPHTVSRTFSYADVMGETISIRFANGDEEEYGSVSVPMGATENLVYDLELDPLPEWNAPGPTPTPAPSPTPVSPPAVEDLELERPSPSPAPDYTEPESDSVTEVYSSTSTVVSELALNVAPGYTDPVYTPFSSGTAPGGNPLMGDMTKDDVYDAVRRGITDAGTVGVPEGVGEGVEFGDLEAVEGEGGFSESVGALVAATSQLEGAVVQLATAFDVTFPTSFGANMPLEFEVMGEEYSIDLSEVPFLSWIRALAYLCLLTSAFFAAKAIIRGAFVDQN